MSCQHYQYLVHLLNHLCSCSSIATSHRYINIIPFIHHNHYHSIMTSSSWHRLALHNAFLLSTLELEIQSPPTTPQITEPDPVLFPSSPSSSAARSSTASETTGQGDTIEPSALQPLAGTLHQALRRPEEVITPEVVSNFGTPPRPMRLRRGSEVFENLHQDVQGSLHPRDERGVASDSDDEYETNVFFRTYQQQYLQNERAELLGNRMNDR